ncbi:MAG: MerR family transcriptional regulator [Erysipelotrichaceae bacterium]
MRSYKIGEFAEKLGVTHDFLKHYENADIIVPDVSEKGYRSYPFGLSSSVIEIIKLRNMGFSVKEIKTIVSSNDNGMYNQKFKEKLIELKKERNFLDAMIHDIEDQIAIQTEKNQQWFITQSEPMYFLPHSQGYDFLDCPKIYEIMSQWTKWMPVVKSCLMGPSDHSLLAKDFVWGFCVSEKDAIRYGIPCNDPVIKIPARRVFEYYGIEDRIGGGPQILFMYEKCEKIMSSIGLLPKGDLVRIAYGHSSQESMYVPITKIMIPIE